MNHVTYISEALLISFYISGHKPHLQRELLVAKPTTRGEVFALARVTEARLVDQQSGATLTTTATSSTGQAKQATPRFSVPKPNVVITSGYGVINVPGSFCYSWLKKVTIWDMMGEADAIDSMKTGHISILNSLIAHESPRSLKLWGTMGSGDVHVLIDNGSTHNFVQLNIVERLRLPVQTTNDFKVYIGSGESLLCENMCLQVTISMKGLTMEVDLYVLPMNGPDVVLGIQWLQKLGKTIGLCVGNKMLKAFPLPVMSSHCQKKFPLLVKKVPPAEVKRCHC
nr:hypothetical protein [Tanacetum cinerariifolium]